AITGTGPGSPHLLRRKVPLCGALGPCRPAGGKEASTGAGFKGASEDRDSPCSWPDKCLSKGDGIRLIGAAHRGPGAEFRVQPYISLPNEGGKGDEKDSYIFGSGAEPRAQHGRVRRAGRNRGHDRGRSIGGFQR